MNDLLNSKTALAGGAGKRAPVAVHQQGSRSMIDDPVRVGLGAPPPKYPDDLCGAMNAFNYVLNMTFDWCRDRLDGRLAFTRYFATRDVLFDAFRQDSPGVREEIAMKRRAIADRLVKHPSEKYGYLAVIAHTIIPPEAFDIVVDGGFVDLVSMDRLPIPVIVESAAAPDPVGPFDPAVNIATKKCKDCEVAKGELHLEVCPAFVQPPAPDEDDGA